MKLFKVGILTGVLEIIVAGRDGFFQTGQGQVEVLLATGLFVCGERFVFHRTDGRGAQAVSAGGVVELVRFVIRNRLSDLPVLRRCLGRCFEFLLLRELRRTVVQQDR